MYYAYVVELHGLRKHSNADRLQCVEVFGNNVIVSLEYYDGQKCVFFPTDGQLSEKYATANNLVRIKDENGNNIGGYLDPEKRNIKAMRLRGEKSEGLLMPIETLAPYVDVGTLAVGDKISTLNGELICQKYIPRRNSASSASNRTSSKSKSKKKTPQITYPIFKEHADTEQLMYNQSAFKVGDTIYLTRKLHGSSMRIANTIETTTKKRNLILKKIFKLKDKEVKTYRAISGTRRTILRDYEGGYYGTNLFRKPYYDYLKDKLPKGMTVYGEIVGWVNKTTPIMSRCSNFKVQDKEFRKMYGDETVFTYGCEPGTNDVYIYRITIHNDDGEIFELPTEEVINWCDKLGMKYVPLLEKFLYTTWDDLVARVEKYLDLPEPLSNNTHISEGIVVRIDNRSSFKAYKHKGYYFKVIEGIIKDEAETPDLEEAEELVYDS